jgi:hypothetical protein
MKKVFLMLVAVIAFSFTAKAQFTQSIVVTAGLQVGDVKDQSNFALSADVYFMKPVVENFDIGLTAGYTNYFGKDYDTPLGTVEGTNVSFLPLAGAFRFGLTDSFSIGSDIGYAFGLSPDGNDGGFYYKPVLGFNIGDTSQLMLSYQGVSGDAKDFNYVGLGFAFGL